MEAKHNRYVYKMFAGDSATPFYIGVGQEKTKQNRSRRERIHLNEARRGSWKSNATKNQFILDCLASGVAFRYEYERGLTTDEAHHREIELIRHYGRRDLGTGCLLNACVGGWGSRDKSPGEIARARARRPSEETKAKIAAAHLGMKQTEESRAKIKAARAKQVLPIGEAHPRYGMGSNSPDSVRLRDATRRYRDRKRGKNVPLITRKGMPGRILPPETIARIAALNRGQKRSPEARARMSAANNRRGHPWPHSEESKAKMRAVKLGKRLSEATKAKMRQVQQRRRALERDIAAATLTLT